MSTKNKSEFNNGKVYHGSNLVHNGKLQGTTDTDYFYFFCPKCPEKYVMRILEYGIHEYEENNPYDDQLKSKAKYGFTLVFKLYCENCKHLDFIKISNMGLQGMSYDTFMNRRMVKK